MFFSRRAAITDGVIDLIPCYAFYPDDDIDFGTVQDFIITPAGKRKEAGRISLRMGEGVGIYYFGHIGYHVDPPFRGHHYAERACRLTRSVFHQHGKTSLVITCDPDNIPSIKTCEHLGCRLERTVDVPRLLQQKWQLSPQKHRYVWQLPIDGI